MVTILFISTLDYSSRYLVVFSSLGQLQSSSSHDFGVFQVIMVLKVASFSEIIMALNICKLCVHLLGAKFHYAHQRSITYWHASYLFQKILQKFHQIISYILDDFNTRIISIANPTLLVNKLATYFRCDEFENDEFESDKFILSM